MSRHAHKKDIHNWTKKINETLCSTLCTIIVSSAVHVDYSPSHFLPDIKRGSHWDKSLWSEGLRPHFREPAFLNLYKYRLVNNRLGKLNRRTCKISAEMLLKIGFSKPLNTEEALIWWTYRAVGGIAWI